MAIARIKPWLHWNFVLTVGLLTMFLGLLQAGIEFSGRGAGRWTVIVLWLSAAGIGYGVFVWGFRRRGRARPVRGYCPRCWYDLRGLDGVTCPECGRHVPPKYRPSSDSHDMEELTE